MKRRSILTPSLLIGSLLLGGCLNDGAKPLPPAPPSAAVLAPVETSSSKVSSTSRQSDELNAKGRGQVAAVVQVIDETNAKAPESPQKTAIDALTDVAAAANGKTPPSPETLEQARKIAEAAASGRIAEARKVAEEAITEANNNSAARVRAEGERDRALQDLKDAAAAAARHLEEERKKWEEDKRLAIEQERAKAKAELLRLATWGFVGLGGLVAAAGVASFFLTSSIPWLGPKVSQFITVTGAGLVVLGIGLQELLTHEWIIWTALGLVAVIAAVAVGLAISNHHHAKESASVKAAEDAASKAGAALAALAKAPSKATAGQAYGDAIAAAIAAAKAIKGGQE